MHKKRKKSPLKGKPAGKIASLRTIRHLDPLSPLHQQDKKVFAEVRARAERQKRILPYDIGPTEKLKYPSLRGGFCTDGRLNILNGDEHEKMVDHIRTSRKYYESIVDGRNGKKRKRRRETVPTDHLAVTFRPDFALAFMAMEEAKLDHLKSFLVDRVLPIIFREFEIATGLEVIAAQIHSEEKWLHFHVSYATVSAKNELLWSKSGVGRRGIRLFGQSGIGAIRQVEGGFEDEYFAADAREYLNERIRENGGDDPIDLRLSRTLDGLCYHFFIDEKFAPFLETGRKRYRRLLSAKKAESPKHLRTENNELRSRLLQAEQIIEKLKQQTDEARIPLKGRLAFLPKYVLADADCFLDVVFALLAKGDTVHLGYLENLVENDNIPLTDLERMEARDHLNAWRESTRSLGKGKDC